MYVGDLSSLVYAFDALGQTNCSGTPKVCQPLWSAGVEIPAGGAPVSLGTAGLEKYLSKPPATKKP